MEEVNKEDESVKCIIPDDLIKCILIWLPISSLCRFRGLSRNWLSYLTDPEFIKARAKAMDEDEQKLLRVVWESNSLYRINLETCLNDRKIVDDNNQRILVPVELDCKHWSIIGSSNGLICIKQKYRWPDEIFFIINSLSEEYRRVIYSCELFYPIKSASIHEIRHYNGFGYDSSMRDYKIIKIRSYNAIDVFSLKKNCWRTVKNGERGIVPLLLPCNSIGEVGGVLHWNIFPYTGSGVKYGDVFTFDLATNKCGMLKDIPRDEDESGDNDVIGVSVFEGCLSVTRTREKNGGYSVWIMKEYGVTQSWTKLMHVTAKYPRYLSKPIYPRYLSKPICYANNGRLILLEEDVLYSKRCILYSTEDGSVVRIVNKQPNWCVFAYKENLVSPYFFL